MGKIIKDFRNNKQTVRFVSSKVNIKSHFRLDDERHHLLISRIKAYYSFKINLYQLLIKFIGNRVQINRIGLNRFIILQ